MSGELLSLWDSILTLYRLTDEPVKKQWVNMSTWLLHWYISMAQLRLAFRKHCSRVGASVGPRKRHLRSSSHSWTQPTERRNKWPLTGAWYCCAMKTDPSVCWWQCTIVQAKQCQLHDDYNWPGSLTCRQPLHGITLEESVFQQTCYCETETQEHKEVLCCKQRGWRAWRERAGCDQYTRYSIVSSVAPFRKFINSH